MMDAKEQFEVSLKQLNLGRRPLASKSLVLRCKLSPAQLYLLQQSPNPMSKLIFLSQREQGMGTGKEEKWGFGTFETNTAKQ